MDRAYEKQKAKEFLKGKYKVPVVAGLLITGIILLFMIPFYYLMFKFFYNPESVLGVIIVYFLEIIFLLFYPILQFAYIKTIIDMAKTQEAVRFRTFVDNLSYVGKALGCFWWRFLWLYIWELAVMLIAIVPLLITLALAYIGGRTAFTGDSNVTLTVTVTIIIILVTAVYVIVIWKNLSYSFDILILAENPDNGVIKSLKDSIALTKNNIGKLLVFELSFIGWILLGLITLGISLLWTTPYYVLSKFNYYKAIQKEKIQNDLIINNQTELSNESPSENNGEV